MSDHRRRTPLGELLKFGKSKGPGYGIQRDYYLSVLAPVARLPALLQVVNPSGEGGAVAGLGAPMAPGADKGDLARPLARGIYAVASPDRKTVVRMMVMPKEEAGFDPEPLLAGKVALDLCDEMRARIRSAWFVIQLTFESYDPAVAPALEMFLGLAARLALLTGGVVADPVSRRYEMPEALIGPRIGEPEAARFVAIHHVETPQGLAAYTLGLQKFGLPEIEIAGHSEANASRARAFLLGLAQASMDGRPLEVGQTYGAGEATFALGEGGFDRARWEGIRCLELVPPRGRTIDETLELLPAK